jgi:hypothetical protein
MNWFNFLPWMGAWHLLFKFASHDQSSPLNLTLIVGQQPCHHWFAFGPAVRTLVMTRTGWPDERVKNSPKLSPIRFRSKLIQNFFNGPNFRKNLVYSNNFPKTTKRTQLPKRRKFAQSGYPGRETKSDTWLTSISKTVWDCVIVWFPTNGFRITDSVLALRSTGDCQTGW